MKWRDVQVGQTLRRKGEPWKVVARDGDGITLLHATLGESKGFPPPEGEVELVKDADPEPALRPKAPRPGLTEEERADHEAWEAAKRGDPEVEELRRYAIRQGVKKRVAEGLDAHELRERVQAIHAQRVAEDNDVPPRKVGDVTLRLLLGATLIADLYDGERLPGAPKVEVMDRQTMANHLHFFHGVYPAAHVSLEELVTIHQRHHSDDKETERHEHFVPF